MKRLMFTLAATAGAVAMAPAANATVLLPGASNVVFGAFNTATQGTLLASQSTGLMGATTYTGAMRSAVYRNTAGTLDFYFQVAINTINPGDEVFNLTASSFMGYTVDAFFASTDIDGGGIFTAANNPQTDPTEASGFTSTASRNGSGSIIRADFGANGLEAAGQTSAIYIYRTNAVNFDLGGTFTTQDGSTAQRPNYQAVGPAVPEPATWAMMMLGFGAMGAMIRRRNTRTSARIRFA